MFCFPLFPLRHTYIIQPDRLRRIAHQQAFDMAVDEKIQIRDSDSGHSPSDDEKRVTGVEAGGFENIGHGDLPPDPDAGYSEAEKAAIVSARPIFTSSRSDLLTAHTGQEAPPEARSTPYSLALPPLPHQLPRQNQYRKRKNHWSPTKSTHHQRSIQCLPHHFLCLLLAIRTLDQYPAQAP